MKDYKEDYIPRLSDEDLEKMGEEFESQMNEIQKSLEKNREKDLLTSALIKQTLSLLKEVDLTLIKK